jgi:uncharacterized DUF497 family protein
VEFVWDDEKNRTKRLKHELSFESAVEVFRDPFELTEFDQTIDGEDRWKIIGLAWAVLVVIYVERNRESETIIRIISARQAT